MSNTLAQAAVSGYSGNTTSLGVTFGSACTNGSLLVVAAVADAGGSTDVITSIADGVGAYTVDVSKVAVGGTGDGGTQKIASRQNASTSAQTVTITPTGNITVSATIFEVLGAPSSGAFDAGNSGEGLGTAESVSVTTTGANDSIFASDLHYSNAGPYTPDSGYTQHGPNAGFNGYVSETWNIDVGAAGAKTITFGHGTPSTGWSMAVGAYKSGPIIDLGPIVQRPQTQAQVDPRTVSPPPNIFKALVVPNPDAIPPNPAGIATLPPKRIFVMP